MSVWECREFGDGVAVIDVKFGAVPQWGETFWRYTLIFARLIVVLLQKRLLNVCVCAESDSFLRIMNDLPAACS